MTDYNPQLKTEFVNHYVSHTGCNRSRAIEVWELQIRGIEAWIGEGKPIEWIAKKAAHYNLEVPQSKSRKRGCV